MNVISKSCTNAQAALSLSSSSLVTLALRATALADRALRTTALAPWHLYAFLTSWLGSRTQWSEEVELA